MFSRLEAGFISLAGWLPAFGKRLILLVLITLAACVPAKTPPQLNATAAPGVVVSGDRYDAGAFRVRFPDGWRAITSPAGASPSVILASPDNCALIVVASAPMDAPEPSTCADKTATFRRDSRTRTLGGATVHAALIAPESGWDAAQAAFAQVADSVEVGAAG